MYHFCYKTTNTVNGKFYLGKHSCVNLDDGYLGSGVALQRAISLYGRSNFKREILCFADSAEEALEIEEILIDERMVESDHCYNLCLGGDGGGFFGRDHSTTTRQKIGDAHRGRKHSEEQVRNRTASLTGKKRGPEALAAITEGNRRAGEAKRGIKFSDEHKANMSKPKARKVCPSCSVSFGVNVFSRHIAKCQ